MYTKEQLLMIQVTIGASVYSGSVHAGLSERNFYRFIYALVGVVFIFNSIYYVQDASARHQLLFQSCSPFAEVMPCELKEACPCGAYPTETQDACPIPTPAQQDACQALPFPGE